MGEPGARRKGKALSQTAANPSRRVFEQAEQLPTQIAKGVGRVAVGDGRAVASGGQAFALFFFKRVYKGEGVVLCTLALCAWTRPAATAGPR